MQRANLLLVDDDPAFVDSFRELLSDDGYAVDVALDGAEALQRARRAHPDLIVLDLRMPVLDGPGFLAAQRADAALAGVPVLVFTAADDDAPTRLGRVYTKPLDLTALLAEIHRVAPSSPAA